MFYLDVAKVDLNVAYICKCFRCFHTYVASILQWLHTRFSSFFWCFINVSNVYYKCFSSFGHMLQAFHLDVVSRRRRCPGSTSPAWARKTSRHGKWGAGKRTSRRGPPNIQARASEHPRASLSCANLTIYVLLTCHAVLPLSCANLTIYVLLTCHAVLPFISTI